MHCYTEKGLIARAAVASSWLSLAVLASSLVACSVQNNPDKTALAGASTTGSGQETSLPPLVQLSDALTAPPQPKLTIAATTGYLNLSWQPANGQTSASIFRKDAATGNETRVYHSSQSDARLLSIPAQTHLRAWHREQFRVELCSDTECVSSQHHSIVGLAESTIQSITPSVFVEQERFAEHIDVNQSATLMVASMPLAGALQLYLRADDQWIASQFIRLENIPEASQRQLQVSLSSSGDTLAVAIVDTNVADAADLRIFERLGESWIETARWRTEYYSSQQATLNTLPLAGKTRDLTIQLSGAGDHLVVAHAQHTRVYQRLSDGWSAAVPLNRHDATTGSSPDSTSAGQIPLNRSIATSANMDTIFSLDVMDATVWLSIWRKRSNGLGEIDWYKSQTLQNNDLDPARDTVVRSNQDGSRFAIAGWESSAGPTDTLVLWRYLILPEAMAHHENSSNVPDLVSLTDSLRPGPAVHHPASLRFDASDDLSTIVIGWQANAPSTSGNNAALFTYQFDDLRQQWISRLELPEAVPTLARSAFASVTKLSGDGNSLLISSAAGQAQTAVDKNRVGKILALQ